MMLSKFTEKAFCNGWVCGSKTCAKVLGSYNFKNSSRTKDSTVSTKSPIVPIYMISRCVFAFSQFLCSFSWHRHKVFSVSASMSELPRSIGTIFTQRWAYNKDKYFSGKTTKNLGQDGPLPRISLKIGNLPPAFIHCDKLLPIKHWTNDLLSKIGSGPNV